MIRCLEYAEQSTEWKLVIFLIRVKENISDCYKCYDRKITVSYNKFKMVHDSHIFHGVLFQGFRFRKKKSDLQNSQIFGSCAWSFSTGIDWTHIIYLSRLSLRLKCTCCPKTLGARIMKLLKFQLSTNVRFNWF